MASGSEKFVRYCPKCFSIRVGMPRTYWKTRAASPEYACKKCGFEGLMPEATVEEIEKMQKEKA